MATNKTDFLNLNDWVGTDPFRREEINANFRVVDAKAKEHNDKLNEHTSQLSDHVSLKTYSKNIKRDLFFNADAGSGVSAAAWSDRQILLLGDSHGWGEGSPNYQGASAGYSIHAPWIHNKSFMDRLRLYMEQKFDSEPWRVGFSTALVGTDGAVKEYSDYTKEKKNKPLYTICPQIIGKFAVLKDTGSVHAYRSAWAKNDEYGIDTYRHNSDIGLFHENLIVLGKNASGKAEILVDIPTPSRYAYIHFGSFAQSTNFTVELLDNRTGGPVKVANFGNVYYGTKAPVVSFINGVVRTIPYTLTSDTLEVDGNYSDFDNVVMKIDFGQKKEGTLRISVLGTTGNAHPLTGVPSFISRGILFGNGDLIRNWSMGGHTVGAWIGEEASYWGETRDHITDALNYMTGSLKASIIEAPLVNERIKGTSIATFKTRLSTLKTKLGTDNIVIFTPLGEKSYEFQGVVSPITYDQYAQAVRDWAADQGGNVTLVDSRAYIKNLYTNGIITNYNDFYINDAHPSPLVNETIFDMLKKVVDLKL